MSHRAEWQPAARRAFKKLPAEVAERVARAVDELAATGRGDVKKLTDVRPPAYRLRVGEWRVTYSRDDAAGVLVIVAIAHRREAY